MWISQLATLAVAGSVAAIACTEEHDAGPGGAQWEFPDSFDARKLEPKLPSTMAASSREPDMPVARRKGLFDPDAQMPQ